MDRWRKDGKRGQHLLALGHDLTSWMATIHCAWTAARPARENVATGATVTVHIDKHAPRHRPSPVPSDGAFLNAPVTIAGACDGCLFPIRGEILVDGKRASGPEPGAAPSKLWNLSTDGVHNVENHRDRQGRQQGAFPGAIQGHQSTDRRRWAGFVGLKDGDFVTPDGQRDGGARRIRTLTKIGAVLVDGVSVKSGNGGQEARVTLLLPLEYPWKRTGAHHAAAWSRPTPRRHTPAPRR